MKTFKFRGMRDYKEQRAELIDECESIQSKLEKLDADGKQSSTEWKNAEKRFREIMDEELPSCDEAGEQADREERARKEIALSRRIERENNGTFDPLAGLYRQQSINTSMPTFRDKATGKLIRALAPNERFPRPQAEHGEEQPAGVGAVIHSLLTGRYDHCTPGQVRAAIGSSDTGGGYLVQPSFGSGVLDLARSASVCMRAGMLTLPLDSNEHTLVRLTQDPTASWRSEGVTVNSSEVTFDRVVMRPKTLAAVVPISIELIEDASNAPAVIEQAMRAAFALKIDQASLFGSGAESEPQGIKNTSGINTVTSVGTPTDYSDVSSAVGKIYTANYPGEASSLAWIHHPREAETYDGLVSAGAGADGQPLQPTPWAAALQKYMTTSLSITEGAGAESSMIVGDFAQSILGMRNNGVQIRIASDGTVTDGTTTYNATSQLMRFIVAYIRVDVAVMRPDWFTVLSGVTNT